jgi:O-antigen/teichoic acid export membrane protein
VPPTFILRNVCGNALSILTSDVMNRATSFVIYALVARHLGAHEFGQLSVAFSLFYVFQVFALAGLKVLIVREVAKERSRSKLYFINSSAIAAVSSTASLATLFLFVRLLRYPHATSSVVMLLSLGLFPTAISAICEGIFQAWECMRLIAFVNVPVNLGKILVAFLLLTKRPELYGVVVLLLGAFFTVAVIETWIVLRRFPEQKASIDLLFAIKTVRSAVTFLGIDGTIAVESSLIILFLSKLATVTEVGLYSAAIQVMVPLTLVYQSIAQSIFPLMCRKVEPGLQTLKRIAVQSVELLLILALPAVAGIFFLREWVLSLFYKNPAFLQAAPVLRIMAWTLMLQVFTSVLGQVLLATHRERITLRIAFTCTLVNLLIGWPLIKLFGLPGAAVTLLLNRLAGSVQHYIPVSRLFSGIPLGRALWRPVLAAMCMAAYLAIPMNQTAILRGISAALIYGGSLLAITVWASGGPRRFREKYLVLLSEKT